MIDLLPKKGEKLSVDQVVALCVNLGQEDQRYLKLAEFIHDNPPDKPFVSDGVSGMHGDKLFGKDLYPAACLHDIKYWCGIPGNGNARWIADCEFAIDLVVLCDLSPKMAHKLLDTVRFGGAEWLPADWRWGFGRAKK